jgi:hypothetical protein
MVDKVIKLDPNFKGGGGVTGFFTWNRLEHILRAAGELREGEHIEGYVLENAGVNFYVKTS